jgi:general secretion pathway protein B
MSYILDALRKADAQRERDASRGIHAQPVPAGNANSPASRMLAWGAAIAGIAAIVVAGLYFTRTTAPEAPAVAAAPAPAPLAPAALQPAEPVTMKPPQEVAKAIAPPPPPPAAIPRGLPPNSVPGGMSLEDRARMAREAAFSRAPAGPPAVPGASPAPQATPQVAQAAPRAEAPAATGLPPDAPKVAISGGVYSTNPAQRMLIVNGQVFNEGSEVAAGLTIEKIDARTAILRFRGARYSVAY